MVTHYFFEEESVISHFNPFKEIMFAYIVKRILYFIPTLFVISLMAFGLSKCTPIDPNEPPQGDMSTKSGFINYEREYQDRAERFGLTGPAFYFDITSQPYPDTLHKIIQRSHRENWENLIAQYGNWEDIVKYKDAIRITELKLYEVPDSVGKMDIKKIRKELSFLKINSSDEKILLKLDLISKVYDKNILLKKYLEKEITQLQQSYQNVKDKSTPMKLYIPAIHWHGLDNQYHRWLSKFIIGDFGVTYESFRPVASEIKDAIGWTFIMMTLAIFVAYIVAIPLGVLSAKNRGLRFDKIVTVLLFLLYSIPSFWIATMMVVFFTTPEYGAWTNIFPSIGLGNLPSSAPFWDRFWETGKHFILPVLCISYNSLAFISRQMRGGVMNVIQQNYIRTARAKGLTENKVIWKHAFRNSLFPIITLFASVFPAALAGSVIIEVIFNIPGMGNLTLNAILNNEYAVVFAVLMIASVMTMIGILVSDILYTKADPRVSFNKK